MSKQDSISNNPEVLALYERYKVDGAVMLDKYKHDEISGSDFEKWIDGMKIRKWIEFKVQFLHFKLV